MQLTKTNMPNVLLWYKIWPLEAPRSQLNILLAFQLQYNLHCFWHDLLSFTFSSTRSVTVKLGSSASRRLHDDIGLLHGVIFSYEKMISGMYLGEVARQVIVKLIQDGCLFNGHLSEKLSTPMEFYTKYISEIER